jgi:hypothetical protein
MPRLMSLPHQLSLSLPASPSLEIVDQGGVCWTVARTPPPPEEELRTYLAFTAGHQPLQAARAFLARYNYAPRYLYLELGQLQVGPIEEEYPR